MRFIDLHCDTISEIRDHPDADHHITAEKLEAGDVILQCFALFTDMEHHPQPEKRAFELYASYLEFLDRNRELLASVKCWQDLIDAREKGLTGTLLTLEEGDVTFGSAEFLQTWYDLGVRMITLSWNHPNRLADSTGLTPYGKDYIRKMEQLGIVVDVSHLNDAAFWDVAGIVRRPFVASHSNARALCDVPRNLTDDMIREIARHRGVIGLNFCGLFLRREAGPAVKAWNEARESGDPVRIREAEARLEELDESRIEDMIRHIRHIMEVGGEEVIALGSDFDGITSRMEIRNTSQLQKLTDRMLEAGFTERQVSLFSHENAQRVLREILSGSSAIL